MLSFTPSCNVYLALGVTDLRANIDGLSIKIQMQFKLDPFTQSIFVFCNRKRNKIKILFWDGTGFWLLYKRLEEGTFKWPEHKVGLGHTICVTESQLSWLLAGLPLEQRKAFPPCEKRKLI